MPKKQKPTRKRKSLDRVIFDGLTQMQKRIEGLEKERDELCAEIARLKAEYLKQLD